MKKIYLLKLVVVMAILFAWQGATAQTDTFVYTGAVQSWTVPPCVTSITVDMQGAIGGRTPFARGGYGARIQCTMTVTPGDVLDIYVRIGSASANTRSARRC